MSDAYSRTMKPCPTSPPAKASQMQVDLINAMRLVDQRADLELVAKGQIAGQQPLESKAPAARV
ncbi:MAG TPA: hypothetical protein EYO82_11160 [Gammaproteobacteria bacterium]|nr:hypothetical protein [Gammaproteobacteria bacterium]